MPLCQHSVMYQFLLQVVLFHCSRYLIKEREGQKKEKETSPLEPSVTRAKHVEGKSPNSFYSSSIPWRVAKLNISAG